SPSAEVQGHGAEPMKMVLNKQHVGIKEIVPLGHYAIRLDFDDGHNSGLFSWSYIEALQEQQKTLWDKYKARITE
ncbi:gamma-butyrobetaine hydroxylase-like domain-containing protein, partial [Pseudoalteromonas undina]